MPRFHLAVLSLCFGMSSAGCTFMLKDFTTPSSKLDAPDFASINEGDSESAVRELLGDPDQVLVDGDNDGIQEKTWEYWRYRAVIGPDSIAESYYVGFTNGKVAKWGSEDSFSFN